MKRLVPAVVVSAAIVAAAPFLRALQLGLKATLPQAYLPLLVAGFGAGLAVALLLALLRIREQRLPRYGLIVGALFLMGVQIFGWNRGIAETDAVERIHFLFYGLVALLFYRALRHWGWAGLGATAVAVAMVGILDEWLQWLVPVRTGELFDVLLNAYAGLCGLLFALALYWPAGGERRAEPRVWRRLADLTAAGVLLLAGFVHSAHLGYAHFDSALNARFHSFFTLEELRQLAAQRHREWASSPPGPLTALEIEDYYRTEAGWRVSYRNACLHGGLPYQAWKENLLLEKYYAPMLEIGYALPPPQRQQLEQQRPRPDPQVHVSPADRGRVFVRPSKPLFWTCTVLLVAALVVVPRTVARRRRPL